MSVKLVEPGWVCLECAKKRGARIPKGHCYTIHYNVCSICETIKPVTEPRDFGKTRNKLRIKFDEGRRFRLYLIVVKNLLINKEYKSLFVNYNFSDNDIDNNKLYFEKCMNDNISPYNALLSFKDNMV